MASNNVGVVKHIGEGIDHVFCPPPGMVHPVGFGSLSSPIINPEWSKTEYLNKVLRDGVRGWQNFVSPPIAYAKVTIEINGQYHQKRADRNGVVDTVIDAALTPGWATVTLHVAGAESRNQDVLIVSENTTNAIICDVDDTVWVTALPRLFTAAWNSFVLDEHARRPVAGMPNAQQAQQHA